MNRSVVWVISDVRAAMNPLVVLLVFLLFLSTGCEYIATTITLDTSAFQVSQPTFPQRKYRQYPEVGIVNK